MFSHGTLLFDSEIENVVSALKANAEKYASKATKSIRSRVANISEFLKEPMTVEQFREKLLTSLFGGQQDIPYYELTEQDWDNVRKLAEERYRSWEWNYGRSPAFNVRQTKRIEGAGTFDVRLQVENGVHRRRDDLRRLLRTGRQRRAGREVRRDPVRGRRARRASWTASTCRSILAR